MALVCNGCGSYTHPIVNVEAQSIRCRQCAHVEPMRILPIFIVTGASGVGKTAVVPPLRRLLPGWEIFETDMLHGTDWQQQRSNWLRVAHSIAQNGRARFFVGQCCPPTSTCVIIDHFSARSAI